MKTVDLILFAGQSNMAGRGITCPRFPENAPDVLSDAGWEYRAVSLPDRLCPIQEPFGKNENRPDGIHEEIKTGSMVSAFVNAYYTGTGIPVVAVSASKGGSVIKEWQPGTPYLTDALSRLAGAEKWLSHNHFGVRHTFVLWCQGESDADTGTNREEYLICFERMLNAMLCAGVEKLFMVRIGHCNLPGSFSRYAPMIAWQEEIARTQPHVFMVSRCFSTMRDRGLMKDAFHYYQAGYNEAGREAGENAAAWVRRNGITQNGDSFRNQRISGGIEMIPER